MTKPVLAIDLDGVVADFVGAYREAAAGLTGILLPEVATVWDWDLPFLGVEGRKTVWGWIHTHPFWWASAVKPLPGAVDFLQHLEAIHHQVVCYCVTARPRDVKDETEAWLGRWGYPHATVVMSGEKGEVCRVLSVEAAIEDHLMYADQMQAEGVRVTVIDRPYNQGWEPRVKTGVEWVEQEGWR